MARALARTKLGERTLWSIARSDPQLLIEALGPQLNRAPRLGTVERWPRSLNGLEDLVFLFASTSLNHGIIALAFDEAAYIYRPVRGLGAATIAEIGRYKGGSTVLIAAAMDRGATLWSYDLHVKLMMTQLGPEIDAEVQRTLERYGLPERVRLVVADSKLVEPPIGGCDLVFIDGDHTYPGVRGDYENWRRALRPGGHLLFHDAAALRPFSDRNLNVARLMNEIRDLDKEYFESAGGTGALLHFVRTNATAPWEDDLRSTSTGADSGRRLREIEQAQQRAEPSN